MGTESIWMVEATVSGSSHKNWIWKPACGPGLKIAGVRNTCATSATFPTSERN